MDPYYQRDGITIYHADCRDILPDLSGIDLVLTDPPYGIDGGRGGNRARGKAVYEAEGWEDTPEYIRSVCVPIVKAATEIADRTIVTPGKRNLHLYLQETTPDDIGCFWTPAATGFGSWGVSTFHPILYYGRDQRAGVNASPSGRTVTEHAKVSGHPCPKPLNAWKWLLNKGSAELDDLIVDPFMGSGTTLVAAKHLGRPAIGIDINLDYCRIAAERLGQEVMPLA